MPKNKKTAITLHPAAMARALDCGNLELFTALDRKGLDEIMEDLARIGITNILNN